MRYMPTFGYVGLALSCLVSAARAQESVVLPLQPQSPAPLLTAPPTPELRSIWSGPAGVPGPGYHIGGSLDFGIYSIHGSGASCGPLLGTGACVNVFSEHTGVGLGWQEWNALSTKTSLGTNPHRP
jgi:hypothetical protein